jgi:hypothetical protein
VRHRQKIDPTPVFLKTFPEGVFANTDWRHDSQPGDDNASPRARNHPIASIKLAGRCHILGS